MATEVVTQAEQWITSTLGAATAVTNLVSTRFYEEMAPRDVNGVAVAFPLVIYNYQPGSDMNTLNGYRVFSKVRFVVRVVGEGNVRAIRQAYQAVDTALTGASFPTATLTDGGVVFSCIRVQPIKYAETYAGKIYRHLGGLYEIEVQ